MNKDEFAILASAIRTYYPAQKVLPNQQAMYLWFSHLKDVDYKAASLALDRWVINNTFAPTIADIRREVKKIFWEVLETKDGEDFCVMYAKLREMERKETAIPGLIGGENEKQLQDTMAR